MILMGCPPFLTLKMVKVKAKLFRLFAVMVVVDKWASSFGMCHFAVSACINITATSLG